MVGAGGGSLTRGLPSLWGLQETVGRTVATAAGQQVQPGAITDRSAQCLASMWPVSIQTQCLSPDSSILPLKLIDLHNVWQVCGLSQFRLSV